MDKIDSFWGLGVVVDDFLNFLFVLAGSVIDSLELPSFSLPVLQLLHSLSSVCIVWLIISVSYTELDQDRCPPVSDITDVHNPCNVQSPVDKERKTSKQTIGNLQMSKHNSYYKDYVHQ
jgi:hypothetical protein